MIKAEPLRDALGVIRGHLVCRHRAFYPSIEFHCEHPSNLPCHSTHWGNLQKRHTFAPRSEPVQWCALDPLLISIAACLTARPTRAAFAIGRRFWRQMHRCATSRPRSSPARLSNASFVDTLYRKVLDRPGDEGGVLFWNRALDQKSAERADVLVEFTQLTEHVGISMADVSNGYWVA